MDEIIERLSEKDENAAYEFAKKISIESVESDKYVEMIPAFLEMLADKNSYVRTRAFMLICNQARWADNGQIEVVFNQMKALLYDPKPTVVRQCLGALHEVILYRPEMIELIRDAVNNIDLSAYKDSMSPLIKKDMDALLKSID
ncbi:MAG: hypothetical protein MJ094_09215 [Saccharofermentans sp.]|nr:hypothetical protein [Saccharofermentans sp.]